MVTVLLAFAIAVAQAAAPSTDLFDQLVARGKVRQQSIKTIGARFTETTVSSLLTRPLVAKGTVVAERSGRMVMKYTSPEPKTMNVTSERLVITWPDPARKPEELNIATIQKRVQKYFADASPQELRKSFQIAAAIDPEMPSAYRIDMKPTRKQIKEGLERLEIWVDKETTLLVRMRMSFPGGDSKMIELEDVQTNVPFDAGR
jgi:outer membrane lipoprotein-sorting protein